MPRAYLISKAFFIIWVLTTGCGGYSSLDEDRHLSTLQPEDAVLYFHGMVYSPADMERQIAPFRSSAGELPFLAPEMFDSAAEDVGSWRTIEGFRSMTDASGQPRTPWERSEVLGHLGSHDHVTVAGYSLGRVPFYHLLAANDPTVSRAVLVDPVFNRPDWNNVGDGGEVARTFLEGGADRRFLLVYGSVSQATGQMSTFEEAMQGAAASVASRFFLCYQALDHAGMLNPGAAALERGWEETHCTSVAGVSTPPPLAMQAGGWARVTRGVNLRQPVENAAPSQRCDLSGTVIGGMPPGTMLHLESYAGSNDGYIWWEVKRQGGTTGCVAEKNTADTLRFLEATAPPAL